MANNTVHSVAAKVLVAVALFAPLATAGDGGARTREWSSETIELVSKLAVQDEGRVKPFSTMAAFSLLRIRHKRSCEDAHGNELEPVEWLLDTMFYPEEAADYPLFQVETHEVIQSLGLSHEGKKKRDLYSYNELKAGRERLVSLGHSYSSIEAKNRTPVQNQTVNLGHALLEFENFAHFLDFARARVAVQGVEPFGEDAQPLSFSEVLAAAPEIVAAIRARAADGGQDPDVDRMLAQLSELAESSRNLRMLPPLASVEERADWFSPGELASEAMLHGPLDERPVRMLAALEGMVAARGAPSEFQKHLSAFAEDSRALASTRAEQSRVDLEVRFYGLDPFFRSLALFLLAFLLVAFTWLKASTPRWLFRGAMVATSAGLVLTVTGIAMRCMVRGRPPVSTLYETVLFITAVAVAAALVMERIHRQRIAGAMAAALGALGLFIAMRFEELQGTDTMPQLVAVLDTNFWLATHVTCITMGYSAGLLAAAFAHLYVLGRVFGIRRGDDTCYRNIARMVYGTLCFSLIFSVVGTILGGVWANESWGRFWGWDPKENGALMIVLSQLAILHGRMGGYLRAFGISMAAILGGVVVAFSWWGVNLLGVGLHSYGFTDGIWRALLAFYTVQGIVMLFGAGWWMNQHWWKRTPSAGASSQASPDSVKAALPSGDVVERQDPVVPS